MEVFARPRPPVVMVRSISCLMYEFRTAGDHTSEPLYPFWRHSALCKCKPPVWWGRLSNEAVRQLALIARPHSAPRQKALPDLVKAQASAPAEQSESFRSGRGG